VLEVRADFVAEATLAVGARMAAAAQLAVPLKVELGSGLNWDEAH
jgi:DNA polymerase-1